MRLRPGRYRPAIPTDRLVPAAWPEGEAERRHLQLLSAALPLAAGTVASHLSAGVLHGLPVPHEELQRITTLRGGSGHGTRRDTRWTRRARLPTSDVTTVQGIPVTTLARTVADLARTLPFPDAVAVADAALRRGSETAEDARLRFLEQLRHRQSGNALARRALVFADFRAESPGESRCRASFALAGVPIPQLQYEVYADGRLLGRADFAWPEQRLLGEYDGIGKYDALVGGDTARAIRQEKAREGRIFQLGWNTIRFTHTDLQDLAALRIRVLDALDRSR